MVASPVTTTLAASITTTLATSITTTTTTTLFLISHLFLINCFPDIYSATSHLDVLVQAYLINGVMVLEVNKGKGPWFICSFVFGDTCRCNGSKLFKSFPEVIFCHVILYTSNKHFFDLHI